ncbi:MAG: DEAD/DEAH box helicase, partial [Acidimicrobiales bacterium]
MPSESIPSDIEVLVSIVGRLPDGEQREGQLEMAAAISEAIATQTHLQVQAGTGTGKSLAYLVPVLRSEGRAVVATATKALQDQLANKDIPLLQAQLDEPFLAAVLKGRSNYICRQKILEAASLDEQLDLLGGESSTSAIGQQVKRL